MIQLYNKQGSHRIVKNVAQAYSSAGASRVRPTGEINLQSAQQANTIQAAANMGQQALNLVQRKIDERDTLDLTQAVSELEKQQIIFEAEYKEKHQGKNAQNASVDFENFTKEQAAKIATDFGLSQRASNAFTQRANNSSVSSFTRGLSFQTQQNEVYKTEVAQNAQSAHLAIINANPNDYARIAESTATFKAEINGIYPNQDNTQIFEKQAMEDAQLMLNHSLNAGDEVAARELYEQTKGILGNNAPNIEAQVIRLEEAKKAQYRQERISSGAQQATDLYFLNNKNPQEVVNSIVANTSLNDEEKREAMNTALSNIAQQERIESLYQVENNKIQKQQIALDMSNMTDPMQMREYINGLPMEQQAYANDFFNLTLNGGDTVSSQEALAEFRTQIQQGHIRTNNFESYKQQYLPYISQQDFIKLGGEMRAKEEQNLADYTKTMFNRDMQNNFGITSTEANNLYNVLDAEAYELGITDPQKKKDYILGQAQKVTVDKGFFSSEQDVPLRQAKEFAALGYEVTIPEDFRQAINKQAALEGKSIDENFIVTQYFNFLEGTLQYNPIETTSTNVATNP